MTDQVASNQTPSEREHDIVRTLVRLADRLVAGDDELELLRDLCASCLRILDADTAGIALADGEDLGFVVATSEDMETIELFQAQRQEGPCVSAFRSGATVHSADLDAETHRWPTWVPQALALGFRSAEAFPMRLRDTMIGALNVYSTRKRLLNQRDVVVGQALADMATIGVLHSRTTADAEVVQGQLQHALDSRVVIEQAKGHLSRQHGISVDEAFERLRSHARAHNARLRATAEAVISGHLEL